MKARNDHTNPPIAQLDKPIYVLRMNWWHWSDANRLKWLEEFRTALRATLVKVDREIHRLRPPPKLCGETHHRGIRCPNEDKGCTW